MDFKTYRISRRSSIRVIGSAMAFPVLNQLNLGCSSLRTRNGDSSVDSPSETFAGTSMSTDPQRGLASTTSKATEQALGSLAGFAAFSPMDRTQNSSAQSDFSGDDVRRGHQILRNTSSVISRSGGIPAPSENQELVIIGGGISGILSGYLLREFKPVVLEANPRFGGNSVGEVWNQIPYSIGAAYFVGDDQGTDVHNLFTELGLYASDFSKMKKGEDPILFRGQASAITDFWEGKSDPKNANLFTTLRDHCTNILKGEKDQVYPKIPFPYDPNEKISEQDAKVADFVKKLDGKTAYTWLREFFKGQKIHPHIETYLEHYSWSTMGVSLSEISAAQFLNEFVCEFGDTYVPVGGNGSIAERALLKLSEKVPLENLRPGSIAINVKVNSDHALVTYLQPDGKLKTIQAKSVIMACPKFIVAKILEGITDDKPRMAAISKINYNGYMVANVLIKRPIHKNFFDLYLMGDGKTNITSPRDSSVDQKITDVVVGTYAKDNNTYGVLTCYRAFPFRGGRQMMFGGGGYNGFKKEFQTQVSKEILPFFSLSEADVFDIRISRFGHAMPWAEPGFIKNGHAQKVQSVFGNRIFFVEQDNWALPAIENCAADALRWSKKVAELLKKEAGNKI